MLKNQDGFDPYITWTGIVENRNDPLMLGRCKVRILNFHPESKQEMPTADLPWCYPLIPLDHQQNVVGPMEGDWIAGYFLDSTAGQRPIMTGYIPGIPEKEANPDLGFNDPRPDSVLEGHQVPRDPESLTQKSDGSGIDWTEISPKSRYPDSRFLREAITSRYERNENIDLGSIVLSKKENVAVGQKPVEGAEHPDSGVGTDKPSPMSLWEEPETPYAAVYPYNHAKLSESGHLIEVDDTPGAERLHNYHRMGTFDETHPDGSKVEKVVGDNFRIVLKAEHTHIEGREIHTVDKNFKLLVNKDGEAERNLDIEVGANGDLNLTVDSGQLNIFCVNGDANICIVGNINIKCTKDFNMEVDGNYNLSVLGNKHEVVGGYSSRMIAGNDNKTVEGQETKFVLLGIKHLIYGDCFLTYLDNLKQDFAKNWKISIASNKEEKIYGEFVQEVLTKYTLNAKEWWIEVTDYMSLSVKTFWQSTIDYTLGLGSWVVNCITSAFDATGNVTETIGGDLTTTVTGNVDQSTSPQDTVNDCFHDHHA